MFVLYHQPPSPTYPQRRQEFRFPRDLSLLYLSRELHQPPKFTQTDKSQYNSQSNNIPCPTHPHHSQQNQSANPPHLCRESECHPLEYESWRSHVQCESGRHWPPRRDRPALQSGLTSSPLRIAYLPANAVIPPNPCCWRRSILAQNSEDTLPPHFAIDTLSLLAQQSN
ncbi:uncharacterized protein BO66DRAFT_122050 [Aspergillus aculeatinus CBS 121060]|uniref:Uncharacterized protein n=1 Tax=Aspergillus aculeatinus CBS 121060 TaxID=1448322 RepID=A0ACD1H5K5_9EURO|nr:hypothetical protein BO66DRAFT_122050 [Aspergillus aculeatinus CBS 121060]RAH68864.1 hypothetical protein BO66DRAFT_122050 [Aspergillus aculeatinus CBS 121060]